MNEVISGDFSSGKNRIIWVRQGGIWWPGEVLDKKDLTDQIKTIIEAEKEGKDMNLHVVKYLKIDKFVIISNKSKLRFEISEETKMLMVKKSVQLINNPSLESDRTLESYKLAVLETEKLEHESRCSRMTSVLNGLPMTSPVPPVKFADLFPVPSQEEDFTHENHENSRNPHKKQTYRKMYEMNKDLNCADGEKPVFFSPVKITGNEQGASTKSRERESELYRDSEAGVDKFNAVVQASVTTVKNNFDLEEKRNTKRKASFSGTKTDLDYPKPTLRCSSKGGRTRRTRRTGAEKVAMVTKEKGKDGNDNLHQKEYEVKRILGKRIVKGKLQYKIDWTGFDKSESTWEPKEHLSNCSELVKEFEESFVETKS